LNLQTNPLSAPYTKGTFVNSPPATKYYKDQKMSKTLQEVQLTYSQPKTQSNFASEVERDFMRNVVEKQALANPGPGDYEHGFKEQVKLIDQQLSLRYKLQPFGTTEERFKRGAFN